jgi:gamma-glutamyltranspeptidase/glutathione hydrolase
MCFFVCRVLLLSCLLFSFASLQALEKPYAVTTEDGKAALATVHPLATEVGVRVIEDGGNAIDAAVAMAFALGVVDGFNSGIGGGLFIVAHTENGDTILLDGREMAPAAAHRDMYLRDGKAVPSLSKTGALAVGVPGSVAALHELQRRAGKLTFKKLIEYSIPLAKKGFPVSKKMASRLERTKDKLASFPETAAIFHRDGQPLQAGDILVQQDLARTYRKLAKKGPRYFYNGAFARAVEKWMQGNQGIVTADDFAAYKIIEREPIRSSVFGYELVGFPPPSSGGIHVAQILTMLELLEADKVDAADRYHRIIEASKLAFADRAYWLGDADFVDVPIGLLDADYLGSRAASVDLATASGEVEAGLPPNHEDALFNRHTTHLSAADAKGNWAAITTTLNTSFGSGVTIPGTGVVMNNQMDDFSIQPGVPNAFGLVGNEANAVAAGKRPLSSMSPSLVFKGGKPVMSVGAAGGPTIISQVSQTIFNYLALGMSLEDAMSTARVHHQWKPGVGFVDAFMDAQLRENIVNKGHELRNWPAFGATQAIVLEDGQFFAESEPRIQ